MQNSHILTQNAKVAFSVLLYHLQQFLSPAHFSHFTQYLPAALKPDQLDIACDEVLIQQATQLTVGQQAAVSQTNALTSIFTQVFEHANSNACYTPQLLSAQTIFPAENSCPQWNKAEWENAFIQGIADIPTAHRENIHLWLDHFETFLQCHTALIPSGYDPSVSFYDYAKIHSAFYTALYAIKQQQIETEKPFLLIQGDFFGIQDFIFSGGKKTNKQAAKLLRGRSFQVSLFTELAALKVLENCQLPSICQIMNVAGKFLILAPNTNEIKQQILQTQASLNQWFIEQTYGLAGLGIAIQEASSEEFISADKFKALQKRLFEQLEIIKLQRLDLTESTESVQDMDYRNGVCELNSYFPAQKGNLSLISHDQVKIGELLAKKSRMIICDYDSNIYENKDTPALAMNIFGYAVYFTDERESTGDFSRLAKQYKIHRFWDFSLAKTRQEKIWNGYARRYINAYIPYFTQENIVELKQGKYKNIDEENSQENILSQLEKHSKTVKTFDYIACEDRKLNGENYQGQIALMTLKGDIDNLGTIFQQGIKNANFAKMATLSRQINFFFSLWLPAFCAEKYPNIYTVFAGGDDFFLIGSWLDIQKLAKEMQVHFKTYVTNNPKIHFSVGLTMTKVGLPVSRLGNLAEDALEKSKSFKNETQEKNAVTIYQRTLAWETWQNLTALEEEIQRLAKEYQISTGYLYSLIRFTEQAENNENNIENTMWRSRFYYRTSRYIIDKLKKEEKATALQQITTSLGELGIAKYKTLFAIPLFNYFYQKR